MQSVGTKNTGPEMVVRRLLHSLGYRYRVHRRDLPGSPDIVFPSRKKAIFVHGCFWHAHGCAKGKAPKSRLDFWAPKLAATKARDSVSVDALLGLGWTVLTLWQCELADSSGLQQRLTGFLEDR